MFEVVKKVVSLFMKSDLIPQSSVVELIELKSKLTKRENQLSDRNLCVGESALSAYETAIKDPKKSYWAKDMAKKLRTGYEQTAIFLLDKLPLTNKTILHLTCLDPQAHKESSTLSSFKELARSLPNVVNDSELGVVDGEIRDFTIDVRVAKLTQGQQSDFRPVKLSKSTPVFYR